MKNTLQTLDRGIKALEIISNSKTGVTVAQLAEELAISRSIVYRIITTLENHGMVMRAGSGALLLGAAAVVISQRFEPQLRSIAQPILESLAQKTGVTAFISTAQGDDCYVIMVEECNSSLLRFGYRLGSQHLLTVGAAGIAILSGRAEQATDTPAVKQARKDGYSVTEGELQTGALGVASPILTYKDNNFTLRESCIGVVGSDKLDKDLAIQEVTKAVSLLARKILSSVK